jgi:hypothetical protein
MDVQKELLRDFVMKHYYDLDAVTEVFRLGKERIADWVERSVAEALQENIYFIKNGIKINYENEEIWWYLAEDDSNIWWNVNKETGLFFSLDFDRSQYAQMLEQPTEGAVHLSLYHQCDNKHEIGKCNKIKAFVQKRKKVLQKYAINIPDGREYIADYVPSSELKLSTIRNSERFPAAIVEQCRHFTKVLLTVMKGYKP